MRFRGRHSQTYASTLRKAASPREQAIRLRDDGRKKAAASHRTPKMILPPVERGDRADSAIAREPRRDDLLAFRFCFGALDEAFVDAAPAGGGALTEIVGHVAEGQMMKRDQRATLCFA